MPDVTFDTIAAIELRTVPSGLATLDGLVKQARVRIRFAGDIDPSRFLVVFDGPLGDVEEALDRAIEIGAGDTLETLLLPRAHPRLRAGLSGELTPIEGPANDEWTLGALQCHTVISTLAAVDRALKAADVVLLRLRVATDLAGQGHAVLAGEQFETEAALYAARETADTGVAVETRLIPRAAAQTFVAAGQRRLGPHRIKPLDA